MLRSLGLKLLMMCLLVLSIAIGTMALFNSQATSGEFVHYLDTKTQQDQAMITQVLDAYKRDPSPAALKGVVEQLAQTTGRRLILTDEDRRVVADSSGELVGQVLEEPELVAKPAASVEIVKKDTMPPDLLIKTTEPLDLLTKTTEPPDFLIKGSVGAKVVNQKDGQLTMLISTTTAKPAFGVIGASVNTTYAQAGFATQAAGPEKSFITSVNQWQWLAVVLAGLVTLGLAVFLSRQIVRPVRALTLAVRQLEKGDLSRRVKVKTHDEIGELARAFNAMAARLARSEQLRRNMVSDVAHELRTPLTNISGYLEALQDGVARPSPQMFASLYEEARLLNRLVSDLQELALAEAGQLKLVRREVDPYQAVEGAVAAVKNLAAAKGVAVSTDLPPGLPMVEADPERLGQILRNLLNNAIQHTPARGRITVAAKPGKDRLEITVQDTGVGIAAEHLPYLFERFYRADRARSRATGGSGLGLAIVKQLVEAHGGQVKVDSKPGLGTSFSFTLQPYATRVADLAA